MAKPKERGIVPRKERKLIYAGIDVPVVNPRGRGVMGEQDLTKQISRLRNLPFDGIVVQIMDPDQAVPYPQSVLGNNLLGPKKHEYRTYAPVIPFLRELKKTPLRDNFLLISTGYWFENGKKNPFNWFDDNRWKIVENNLKVFFQLARQSGVFRGIMLDAEAYPNAEKPGEEREWAYSIFSLTTAFNSVNNLPGNPDPKGTYLRRLRERGARFHQILEEKLPGAPILLFLGYGLAEEKSSPNNADMLPQFLDGILENIERSGSQSYVIDGFEGAYKYRTAGEYKAAREAVKRLRGLSAVPHLYDKYVRVGYGKWLDAGDGGVGTWNEKEEGKNYYSPRQWEDTLRLALDNTDEYVWIWSGGKGRVFPMTFGRPVNVPPSYLNALRRVQR